MNDLRMPMPLSTSDIVVGTARSFLKLLNANAQRARTLRTQRGLLAPILFFYSCLWSIPASFAAEEPKWFVGVAKTDITPDEPVRLSGYASRTTPTTEIEDRLFARALILTPAVPPTLVQSPGAQSPGGTNGTERSAQDQTSPNVAKPNAKEALVIVSIDAIGITSVMTENILKRVLPKLDIPRSRIVFCTTHSHTAPHLDGLIPNLFGVPFPEAEHQAMLRTTQMTVDRIGDAILKAFENQKLGKVHYGLGRAEFAINRRMLKENQWVGIGTVDNGPVDRNVKVLKVSDAADNLIAVTYQYACHSTSISPDANRISADWGGIAAGIIEQAHPDCIALPIIGCGADANPNPRGTIELSRQHGAEMAKAVQTVIGGELKPLPAPTNAAFTLVALSSSDRPSREKLQAMQQSPSAHERNFANTWLEVLSRKDRIPETYPAPVHLWTFGQDLGWVFMGGEVVVDYQIRLEKELSQFQNVWVAAYTDDVFAYVASERVRFEGGYEVDGSMLYYGQPGRWDTGTENQIVDRVLQLTKQKLLADQPRSPKESLESIEVPSGWTIELVASEPLITDPVGISFGADGKVWVVEMSDYPLGGKSGAIKTLADTDGDGVMDHSTTFLDGLQYPAGVYAWRDGCIVACAPNIFFARDTDGDGKCDERIELLTGFPEGNPQHRVHGFTYGMDHRLHFGPGGGAEQITLTGRGLLNHLPANATPEVTSVKPESTLRISGSDLSLDPDRGELQLETGVTQFIRTTDELGNWFGNENSLPMFHYVFPHSWMAQSGYFPPKRYHLMTDPPSIPPVFPLSQQADRFNDLYAINRFTSACSTIINRGAGQGEGMRGFALVCEPVHNLVARYEVAPLGLTWKAQRIAEDAKSEFIRSSDPWFRPVRIENAPDGTLWVVDMYRYVIEHPEWIPEEWQRRINLRAGEDRGRIYRIRRTDFTPLPISDFSKLSQEALIQELAGPNSARADLAQQILIAHWQENKLRPDALEQLQRLLFESVEVRSQIRIGHMLLRIQAIPVEKLNTSAKDLFPATQKLLMDQWHQIQPMLVQNSKDDFRERFLTQVDKQSLLDSPAMALSYAVLASQSGERFSATIAKVLVAHANYSWLIQGTHFLAPGSVDGILRQTLSSAQEVNNARRIIEALVQRCSPELKSELLRSIAEEVPTDASNPTRPTWHFLLAKQFSTADSTGLDNDAIDRLLNAARAQWNQYLTHPDSANTATLAASMELLFSRMGRNWTDDHQRFLSALTLGQSGPLDAELTRGLWRSENDAEDKILDGWSKLSAESRRVVLNLSMTHGRSFELLLHRIQAAKIPIQDIDASTLQQLRDSNFSGSDNLKRELFGDPPGADRPEIVRSALKHWPSKTDPSVGQAAYKKHCAACHDPRPQGEQIQEALGPNLRGLSHWTNEAWMTAILDPNRSVEEKYWVFQANTVDGESLVGLKIQEDDRSIEWVDATGKISRIEKSVLSEYRVSQRSLMPEGFEQLLSPEDLAAVVSFLRSDSQDRR